jgi:hypothetical protein
MVLLPQRLLCMNAECSPLPIPGQKGLSKLLWRHRNTYRHHLLRCLLQSQLRYRRRTSIFANIHLRLVGAPYRTIWLSLNFLGVESALILLLLLFLWRCGRWWIGFCLDVFPFLRGLKLGLYGFQEGNESVSNSGFEELWCELGMLLVTFPMVQGK